MTEDWSNHPDNDEDDKLLSAEVMGEVRRLRLQLQLCIDNNDQLRQRLEDCARHHHAPPPSRCGSCARPLTGPLRVSFMGVFLTRHSYAVSVYGTGCRLSVHLFVRM